MTGDPLVDVPVRDVAPDGSTIVELRSWPSVGAKLADLCELAAAGARRHDVITIARMLGSVARAHAFVRDAVRYEDEPAEMLESPSFVLSRRASDCEGQAACLAALALVLGHSAILVPMGGTPDDPAHLAILVTVRPAARPCVAPGAWQPWGLRAPTGTQWAETTVRAELGEIPSEAARRLGEARADLGG